MLTYKFALIYALIMLLQIENFTKNFFVEDVGKAQSKLVSVEEEFFLLFDPTHIVKNIYNNFLTKKVFKMPMLSPVVDIG